MRGHREKAVMARRYWSKMGDLIKNKCASYCLSAPVTKAETLYGELFERPSNEKIWSNYFIRRFDLAIASQRRRCE
jgi:uncharacterized protein YifE (UPF0438 family)